MPEKEIGPNLTKGSKCRVTSRGDEERQLVSVGEFRGYVAFGHDSAISIELDTSHGEEAGRIRIIPCGAVLSLDLIHMKEEEKEERKEELGIYFG